MGQVNYPKVLDEDSNDALSPEQPASQESQSSALSPGESKMLEMLSSGQASPVLPNSMLQVRYRYEYGPQVLLYAHFLNNHTLLQVYRTDTLVSLEQQIKLPIIRFKLSPALTDCSDSISVALFTRALLFCLFRLIQVFPAAPQAAAVISTNEPSAFQPAVAPITSASSKPGPTLVKVGAFLTLSQSN